MGPGRISKRRSATDLARESRLRELIVQLGAELDTAEHCDGDHMGPHPCNAATTRAVLLYRELRALLYVERA